MMQPGGAGARPQVPALPAGEPACSRGMVMYQIVRVNDPPGKVVLRKMSGVEVHITPNRTWAHYTVRSLRSQLAEFDVFDDVSENSVGWATKSFVASHISVVVGDKVAALNQLVAALWDSNFLIMNFSPLSHPFPRVADLSGSLRCVSPPLMLCMAWSCQRTNSANSHAGASRGSSTVRITRISSQRTGRLITVGP